MTNTSDLQAIDSAHFLHPFTDFKEFLEFIHYRKRYWLLPIIIVLLALSGFIVFLETSTISPFIYVLF